MSTTIWAIYKKSVAEAIARRHYARASSMLKDALSDAKVAAEISPELLTSADEMATLHLRNGDFNNSASIYRVMLDAQQKALGAEHPQTERTLQSLLRVLGEAGSISPKAYA